MSTQTRGSGSLSRRATLTGAGLAVGTLWVAPLVQVISMESASAASTPPPRVQAGGGTTTVASGPVTVASGPASDGVLPQTGASDAGGIAAAGGAAVAVGVAAVVTARRMSKQDPAEPVE
jgi:LPXTG-motif cell wall-anchored protein